MFQKDEVFSALDAILDTKKLTEKACDNYLIDESNHFGFTLDAFAGITLYYHTEHVHLWKYYPDDGVTKAEILDNFVHYVTRLLNRKIIFIYTSRGGTLTRTKIVDGEDENDVIAEYGCTLNPLVLLFKKKEKRETVEFKQS